MNRRRVPLPPKDDATKCYHFLETVLSNDTTYRVDRMRDWERARLYVKLNQQWLEDDVTEDPTRTPFFKAIEVDERTWQPMPTHNEMVAPIQNEVARLERNGSRPYILATNDAPKIQRAAKKAKDVLLDTLQRKAWRQIEHEGCDQMVTYGTWILKTYWEIDYTKTVRLPITTALKCPECDFKLAEAKVPEKHVLNHVTNPAMRGRSTVTTTDNPTNPLVPPKYSAAVTHCLHCQEQPEIPPTLVPGPPDPVTGAPTTTAEGGSPAKPVPQLVSYVPEQEEAKSGKDFYKRPLGQDLAMGDVGIKNVSVFDYHPENNGLDIGWQNITEHGEEEIVSLDWIANHYPQNAHLVEAANVAEIMRWHPIVGGSRYVNGGGGAGDPAMFDNHAILRTWHKEPWNEIDEKTGKTKLNRGRSIVMAGDVLLLDDDYMIECRDENDEPTGELIPRVHYEIIPWEIRDKEVFGQSAPDLMYSQQNSINLLVSQVQYARHIFGNPKVLAEEGMDLLYAGFADTGYNSDILYYRPVQSGEKPTLWGNEQMSAQWEGEYQHYVDSIQRTTGTMDVEIGQGPGKDITAASAIMYMGEKASERRVPRIDRIKEAKKRAYKHILQLLQEKVREERSYTITTASNRRTVRTFKGLDIMDQNEVVFDDEPYYDAKMFRREAIKEALTITKTIVADTALARRKINRELGVPLDVNEEQNRQIERAQDEWIAFDEDGIDPAISMRADAHVIHAQQHMEDLSGDDAQRLMDDLDWNQVELALWGWDEDFDALMAAKEMLKLQPLTAQPLAPMPGPDGQIAPGAAEAAAVEWEQKKAISDKLAAMPKALELQIWEFQKAWLDDAGIFVMGPPDPMTGMVQVDEKRKEKVHRVLRFRAHAEGHYRAADIQAKKAAMAAMPAPPGGPQDAQGMVPAGPATAMPGAGAGPGAATASGGGPPPA